MRMRKRRFLCALCACLVIAFAPPAALADGEPAVTLAYSGTPALNAALSFTLSGTNTVVYSLMAVFPDSSRHFYDGAQSTVVLSQPGVYAFIAYGANGDDPSAKGYKRCMSAMETINVSASYACQHTFSAHPHLQCDSCHEPLGNEGVRYFDCAECFPLPGTLSAAQYFANLAYMAYKGEHLKESTKDAKGLLTLPAKDGFTRIVLERGEFLGDLDAIGRLEETADGQIVFTLAFEGSIETADWINDFMATADYAGGRGEGIHSGFNNIIKTFLAKSDAYRFPLRGADGTGRDYTLTEIIGMAKSQPNVTMHIAGHSLGGALSQVFTYYMNRYEGIPPERMLTYTFASPIPFLDRVADSAPSTLRVYNFINENDIVPKLGVAEGLDLLDEEEVQYVHIARAETDLPTRTVEIDPIQYTKFGSVPSKDKSKGALSDTLSYFCAKALEVVYNAYGAAYNTVAEPIANYTLHVQERTMEIGGVLYNVGAAVMEGTCNAFIYTVDGVKTVVQFGTELSVNKAGAIMDNIPSLLHGRGGYNINGRNLGTNYYFCAETSHEEYMKEHGEDIARQLSGVTLVMSNIMNQVDAIGKHHDMPKTYLKVMLNASSITDFSSGSADYLHASERSGMLYDTYMAGAASLIP